MKLKDKVAIVTGGAGGIGRATVLRLAKEGANVVLADAKLQQANKVANEVKAMGCRTTVIETDVTKSDDVDLMVRTTLDNFGQIDILVNVAGGTPPPEKYRLFHESSEETWDWVIALNLKGVRNSCRSVIGPMMQKRSGKIVSIASVAGVMGSYMQADYSAAKAGVIGFTRVLAKEVGSYGINVNCVSPGPIETEPLLRLGNEAIENRKKWMWLGRLGKPEEVANTVAFLVSGEVDFITGQNIPVCGGKTLGF